MFILSKDEFAKLITDVITGYEIDDTEQYNDFTQELANVVAKHFGGSPAIDCNPDFQTNKLVYFYKNDEMPENPVYGKYTDEVDE